MQEIDPWCVPVPVRSSSFIALRAEHAALNVEVDLARVGAFAGPGAAVGRDDLLYADLQTNADVNVARRLGAGRAGCYRGYYLKGVGRTLLAGNWNDADDWQHSSGTLPASAAIRELIASRFLEAAGAGDSIVPCEGVLVRPHRGLAPPAIRIGDAVVRPPPVDERLHAITVKRAGFARWSNFVWLAGQLSGGRAADGFSVASFVERLAHHLAPGGGGVGGLDPAALVARWQAAQHRTEQAFRGFLRHGVYWGSFHNNHTIDGRFLDLEVPVLIGSPFLGALSEAAGATSVWGEHPAVLVGIEIGYLWEDLRATLVRLEAQLGAVAGVRRGGPEQQFLRELRCELRRWLRASRDPLARPADRLARVIAILRDELGLPASAVPALRALLGPPLRASRRVAPVAVRRLRALDARIAPPEQAFAPRLFALEALDVAPPCPARLAFLNDLIRGLDACRDADQLLAGLADAERAIARTIAPARASARAVAS